jgi:multidrug efflux pump subunit AcrA (membrane-fusion protein)
MRHSPSRRLARGIRLLLAGAALVAVTAGCHQPPAAVTSQEQVEAPRTAADVRTVRPERKTVRATIEQPGFNIEAFQETPLYARIAGYVGVWHPRYDIGRSVGRGEVLAELSVPEMEAEVRQKEAAVRQAAAQVRQAQAAEQTARAQLDRAESQSRRLERVGKSGVVSEEGVEEARLGFKAAQASAGGWRVRNCCGCCGWTRRPRSSRSSRRTCGWTSSTCPARWTT